MADDWTASKLRGSVLVSADTDGNGPWQHLKRGDVVSDARAIRTLESGNVEFTRGAETIAFGPNSQGEIVDRTGKLYTTVVQQFGAVAIEAEAKQVQHFAVQTPFLVAVVKGTIFSVVTDKHASRVSVSRGLVAVTDLANHKTLMVPAGQQVQETASGDPAVTGTPNAALTHPTVNGVVEDASTTEQSIGVSGAVGGTVSDVGGLVSNTAGDLGSTVSGVTGALGGATGGVVGSTVSSLGSTVGSTVSSVGSTVGSVGGALGGTLQHLGL
ncbi:MAG: FecR domain-containing protein [Devosia sp.]